MSTKESKAIKAASHREAIQKAAVINNPATVNGKSNKPTSTGHQSRTAQSGGEDNVSSINFTVGPVGDPINDDYEGNKVNKTKRTQQDADIRMVADLDRWG